MVAPKPTVATTHAASDVVIIISLLHVQSHAQTHQNVHSVLGTTRLAIKVVQSTGIFNEVENKLQK